MTDIIKRLGETQRQLKAPKDQRNEFGGFNYRSCEGILEAVKPLLEENEAIVISDEMVEMGGRFYVMATAAFYLGDTDNPISTTAFARETETKKGMDAAQITGAASSYARKYALNGLLLIDDTKDADSMDNRNGGKNDKPTGTQLKKIMKVAKEYDNSLTEVEVGRISDWFWKNNTKYGGETARAADFLAKNFGVVSDKFMKAIGEEAQEIFDKEKK